jgi:zinc/manganese transport system substrate-binding protein
MRDTFTIVAALGAAALLVVASGVSAAARDGVSGSAGPSKISAAPTFSGAPNLPASGGSRKVKVVASTLDMADFVKEVGGDRVEVDAVFKGLSDLHFFEPVPSQVMKLKRADALVVVGLDADVWIRSLIDASRNERIRFGAPGYIDPSDGVHAIQVPAGHIDGSMGDVHPYGNPHYWFTPENVRLAVGNICEGLSRVSPADASYFAANRDRFIEEVDRTFAELKARLAPFAGAGVIEYHASWDYFCDCMGLRVLSTLEPKPGIPPTPGHLRNVIQNAKRGDAKLMLIEPYYPEKPVEYVARETGIRALRLPIYLGTTPGIDRYVDLLKHDASAMADALSEVKTR